MITAGEIFEFINEIAPFDTQMSFDNSGLLVGSMNCSSELVLTALDASCSVVEEAKKSGARMIVTHHPVIFDPLRKLYEKDAVFQAAANGITIISAHTNLDVARGGVNDTLAEAAGVKPDEFYDEDCALFGEFSAPGDASAIAERLCKRLGLSGLRYTDNGKLLHKAVVSCGSGGKNIFLAQKVGADAFITGEIKHHEIVFANDNNIAVFDLGHYGSEDIIIPVLTKKLSERFPGTVFRQAENDSDGVRYLNGGNYGS